MTQGKDDLMGIFTDYDCHDVCPRDIAAFRVVNKLADSSTIHRVTGRENYALTFVVEGSFIYYYDSSDCAVRVPGNDQQSFECREGEMTFLPIGSLYHHRNPGPAVMYVLYFSLTPDFHPEGVGNQPILIKPADPSHFRILFEDAVNKFFKLKRSNLEVKSALCAIISALASAETMSAISEHEFSMISPALNLLACPMSKDSDVPTVAGLARLCCLSEFAFREIFKRYTGITPKKFIILRRIEQVESLLISDDITATDAALSCGFSDPSYFFKLYKHVRGRTLGSGE